MSFLRPPVSLFCGTAYQLSGSLHALMHTSSRFPQPRPHSSLSFGPQVSSLKSLGCSPPALPCQVSLLLSVSGDRGRPWGSCTSVRFGPRSAQYRQVSMSDIIKSMGITHHEHPPPSSRRQLPIFHAPNMAVSTHSRLSHGSLCPPACTSPLFGRLVSTSALVSPPPPGGTGPIHHPFASAPTLPSPARPFPR